jgi:integrase
MSRSEAQTAITAVRYLCPGAKERGDLQIANNYLSAWKKMSPSTSHAPMPKHISELLALRLIQSGLPGTFDAGVALLLAFDTYVRHSEVVNLRNQDVLLPGDPGNFGEAGTIYVRRTKAGKPQTVVLDHEDTCYILESFLAYKRRHGRKTAGGAQFFDFSSLEGKKMTLLSWLKWAQVECGYRHPLFVVHSCRHGGATHDFMVDRRSIGGIKVRGRWKSYTALEIYLQVGQANLAALHVPRPVRRFFNGDLKKARRTLDKAISRSCFPPAR